jgi:hypothetical protein
VHLSVLLVKAAALSWIAAQCVCASIACVCPACRSMRGLSFCCISLHNSPLLSTTFLLVRSGAIEPLETAPLVLGVARTRNPLVNLHEAGPARLSLELRLPKDNPTLLHHGC